jgi:acetyl-CoA C-acetyltransferase
MAGIEELGIDPEKVNVNGGGCSIGHPIGATGARLMVTLLYAMKDRGAKKGLSTMCIGGGEALSTIVELV